jgi:hypothetical protein
MRIRGVVYPNEDVALDEREQRLRDEAAEVLEAFIEGRQAGVLQLGAGLNKYEPGTPQHDAWERGRSSVEGQRAAEQLRQRARSMPASLLGGGIYCERCTCGGKGVCRDAA